MLGHVSIRVLDLEASVKFYLSLLSPFSYEPMRFPTVVGLGPAEKSPSAPIPCFWLRQYTPNPQNSSNSGIEKPTPVHVSFYARDRKQVDEFHARGLEAGGRDNGPPGVRPIMENYYGISVYIYYVLLLLRSDERVSGSRFSRIINADSRPLGGAER
jgi:catechol 2,3-dioxygenase-like lactoylglutathione lyase family enzyme